jgi:cellulose synthase/poly-beta-1,6-N-acetylglucosamine synthase-like glycosyltransferase
MIAAAVLSVAGIYISGYVLYQVVLFAANWLIADAPEFEPSRLRRFAVLVPAHNEEQYLPRLLESLQGQAYPADRFRVKVIADNCTDGTARASGRFDADILERTDATHRGKGHALRWALDRIDLAGFDAVVVVDGDSWVNPQFLKHLNLQMERGDLVIQSYNGVANPEYSWFTRLMDISETMANEIVHRAKRKLGLSCHLLGNGMCFDVRILALQPWDAFSVGEDWEYYAKLVQRGVLIGYSRDARQYHQESVGIRQASQQRFRWSGGRFQVLRDYGPSMIANGFRTRNLRSLDACLPLVLPNPSLGMNLTFTALAAASVYWWLGGSAGFLWWYTVLALLQMTMFGIAILYTKHRAANALSLFVAPIFLAWKMGIDLLSFWGAGTKEWKQAERTLS